MTRVSDFQLNQVVHIGHLAQECVAEKDFAQIMTRELMGLLHACSGVFIEYDPGSPTNELLCGTSYQVDHSNMKKYLDYYQFLDPTLPRFRLMSRSQGSASVSTEQVIESDSTYEECEFYQDFLRPTRVHAAMIFGVNIDGRQFGLVGLHRTKPMGHFSEGDHKLTQLLIPYLSMALRFRYSQRQQQRRDDVVTNLLRARGIRGYLMLDQNFVLRDVVGEFESPDLVVKGADLQRMRGCSVFQWLSPSVKESLLRRRTTAAAAAVEITNRRDPYRVEVVQHSDGSRHFVLVALNRSHSLISERRVRERSLSPRQAQVVKLVALGMTNAEISASLGIQTKTVENYLTAIYQKTGTSNRTELVAVLSN